MTEQPTITKLCADDFFLNAIAQPRNRLETPIKLATTGRELVDLATARQSIERRLSASVPVKEVNCDRVVTTEDDSELQEEDEIGFAMALIADPMGRRVIVGYSVIWILLIAYLFMSPMTWVLLLSFVRDVLLLCFGFSFSRLRVYSLSTCF